MAKTHIPALPLKHNYLLDNLPLDVIQYEIYPYLDYNSKVTMNSMLPPQDRIRAPLKKDHALSIFIHILAARLSSFITNFIHSANKLTRVRSMFKMYRNLHLLYPLIQHCKKMRDATIEKMIEMSDLEYEGYDRCTKYVRVNLSKLIRDELDNIHDSVPYLYEYKSMACNVHWSAVDAGSAEIVEGLGQIPEIHSMRGCSACA
jgi:hypothetical protein